MKVKVGQAIEMAKNKESLKGLVIEDLGDTQVSAVDALALAEHGIVLPEQNIYYNDDDIAYDPDFDEVEWSKELLKMTWEEKIQAAEKIEKNSPGDEEISVKIKITDHQVRQWAKENNEKMGQIFSMPELLPIEQQELAHCEAVIERGFETFFEIGRAMAIIRDKRLYRADFSTFEEYCSTRWSLERRHAYRLMDASKVIENVSNWTQTLPATESHARPLTSLEPDQQREAWTEVVQKAQASGKPITAAKVRAVVDTFKTQSTQSKEEALRRRLERLKKKMGSEPIPDDQKKRMKDLDKGKTVVLNIHKDLHLLKYAIDKGLYVRCDGVSEWANPFVANVDGTYEEVYNLYAKHYLPFKKELLSRIHELKGKALGAHCYPEKCHCEVLRDKAEKG